MLILITHALPLLMNYIYSLNLQVDCIYIYNQYWDTVKFVKVCVLVLKQINSDHGDD